MKPASHTPAYSFPRLLSENSAAQKVSHLCSQLAHPVWPVPSALIHLPVQKVVIECEPDRLDFDFDAHLDPSYFKAPLIHQLLKLRVLHTLDSAVHPGLIAPIIQVHMVFGPTLVPWGRDPNLFG